MKHRKILRVPKVRRLRKVPIIVGSAIAAVAIGGGTALAVWTVNGSGFGGAAATVAIQLQVTAITPSGAGASLYPGGPPGAVYFSVKNPNPYAVTITGYQWGVPVSNDTTTCPNSNVSLDPSVITTTSVPVPAGQTAVLSVGGAVDLSHSAPDGCQGVSFTVPLTVTGVQQ